MALKGKALDFAEWLKKSLEEEGIAVYKKTDEIQEEFQKALEKSMTAYTPELMEKTSKNVTSKVSKNLEEIEKLCNACFFYKISDTEYKKIKKRDDERFPKMGEPLSEEAKKLAKALYLALVLKDFTLKDVDVAVLSVVYCAATLCEECRAATNVGYAYLANVCDNYYPTSDISGAISNEARSTAFYKLIPELKSALPDYLKKLQKGEHYRKWK